VRLSRRSPATVLARALAARGLAQWTPLAGRLLISWSGLESRRDRLFGAPERVGKGIPLAVKDLFDTAGVRTTYGSILFADHVPDRRVGRPARGGRL
jgi:amidase